MYNHHKDTKDTLDAYKEKVEQGLDPIIAQASVLSTSIGLLKEARLFNADTKAFLTASKLQLDITIVSLSLSQAAYNIKNENYSGAISNIMNAGSGIAGVVSDVTGDSRIGKIANIIQGILATSANIAERGKKLEMLFKKPSMLQKRCMMTEVYSTLNMQKDFYGNLVNLGPRHFIVSYQML